ncbi:MAG TPA: hypothetical protein DCY88_20485, partial [Cyanobacteria bacterium UBA11372]|nr:hypothetical protein [Cyanobacteria bacterium UBA11372]
MSHPMNNTSMDNNQQQLVGAGFTNNLEQKQTAELNPPPPAGYAGQRWLVEERDACGVGFIATLESAPSHEIVTKALSALTCLEHRGGCSADQDSGDGSGLMT